MFDRYLKNVTTLNINEDKCIGCSKCVNVCPHQILSVNERICHVSDKDLCMECGACMMNCPKDAIQVKKGAGCFVAIVNGALTGREPFCGCEDDAAGCC